MDNAILIIVLLAVGFMFGSSLHLPKRMDAFEELVRDNAKDILIMKLERELEDKTKTVEIMEKLLEKN